jgi:hypothetical protein
MSSHFAAIGTSDMPTKVATPRMRLRVQIPRMPSPADSHSNPVTSTQAISVV